MEVEQKVNQIKNVAVAIIKNENGEVLLVQPSSEKMSIAEDYNSWEFPSNTIIPGATYNETFATEVLEHTGCIVEARSLISSQKLEKIGIHYEYVECKIITKEKRSKTSVSTTTYKWIHPSSLSKTFFKKFNKDIIEFFDL